MAFADPQSVTISGTPTSLARTGSGIGAGTFGSNDGAIALDIRHSYGKARNRRTIGFAHKKYAADPLRPTDNKPVNAGIRLVVDEPIQGYTPAELEALVVGFVTSLTAGTNANLKKLLGGEA